MDDAKFEMLPMKLLVDLTEKDCKWPVKEDHAVNGWHWFCGRLKPMGQPYCARHTEKTRRER